MTLYMIITGIAGLLLGSGVILIINSALQKKRKKDALAEIELLKKDQLIEFKEKFIALKAEHEQQVQQRNAKIQDREVKLQQREMQLNQKQGEFKINSVDALKESQEQQLNLEKRKVELDQLVHQAQTQLENVSGLSAAEAKEQLIESLKDEAKTNAMAYINDIMAEAKMTANKEAKRVIINTIQRVATETAIENSVTVFHIESDEIKGRIIGREGRNIGLWKPLRCGNHR